MGDWRIEVCPETFARMHAAANEAEMRGEDPGLAAFNATGIDRPAYWPKECIVDVCLKIGEKPRLTTPSTGEEG